MSTDVKWISLEEAESFTGDQVTSAIKSCRSSRAYGPDSLSIFHLKNLGPLATEHLTTLYNDSLKSCRLPSIWKTSLVIPILKPGKDSSQGSSYRPISMLCPAAKVLEALILPSINEFISPAKYQHRFRPRHSSTSALLSSQQTSGQASTSGYHLTSLLQVNTNVPLMIIITNFLQHILCCFIFLLQRSPVSEGSRGKPVAVVQQNTFQRSLAAVNEPSPIFWLVMWHSKLVQKLYNICTVHQILLFIEKNGGTLHVCCARR